MDEARFERALRTALHGMAPAAAGGQLRQRVEAIPREARRYTPAAIVWRAAAGAAVAAVAAVLVLGLLPRATPPVTTTSPIADATAAPSSSPTAISADLDPSTYATDPRLHACLRDDRFFGTLFGSVSDLLYAFELPMASEYRAHLPGIGYRGDLANSDDPALVVVARSAYPPQEVSPPFAFFGTPPESVPTPEPTPVPGFRAVCIGLGGGRAVDLGNVADEDIVLPPDVAPVAGPTASRFALLDDGWGEIAAITWNPWDQALWVVTTGARLVRVSADGSTIEHWVLPTGPDLQPEPTIQAGVIQPLTPTADYFFDRVDLIATSDGAMWVAAGYGLVRFDPATQTAELRSFPADPTILEGPEGHWLSAIAADGTDVVISVNQESVLRRVAPDLGDVGTIPLPSDAVEAYGLAVSGDAVYVGLQGSIPNLLVLNREGTVTASGSAYVTPRSLRPAPDGRAALLPTAGLEQPGELFSSDGTSRRLTVPLEAVAIFSPGVSDVGRALVATDWSGHTWYTERRGGYEILVVGEQPHL